MNQVPDAVIKSLMRELGEAITEALGDAPRVNEAVQRLRDAGYEVHLVIDTRIGFSRKGGAAESEAPQGAPKPEEPARLRITNEDAKFLKSLKISVDTDA